MEVVWTTTVIIAIVGWCKGIMLAAIEEAEVRAVALHGRCESWTWGFEIAIRGAAQWQRRRWMR
jgi:hypothetical protein